MGYEPEINNGGGTSDGRWVAPMGTEVIELGPINETIHQINEKVNINDLEKLKSFSEIDLTKFFNEAAESLKKFDKIQGESVSDMNEFMDSYNKKI